MLRLLGWLFVSGRYVLIAVAIGFVALALYGALHHGSSCTPLAGDPTRCEAR